MTSQSDNSIDPDALRIAANLMLLGRELDHQVRSSAAGDPLSVTDLSVMRQIELGNDLPSLVARALRLDPGRVTRITGTLVAMHYVERSEDLQDRRRCRLQLTESGIQRLRTGRATISTVMNRLLGALTPEERTDLAIGLEGGRRVLDRTPRTRGDAAPTDTESASGEA